MRLAMISLTALSTNAVEMERNWGAADIKRPRMNDVHRHMRWSNSGFISLDDISGQQSRRATRV
jgi:hypothetical protein